MQIERNKLIEELLQTTEKSSHSAKRMKELTHDELNFKKNSTEWSILECIEHLNLYGDFYLPEMERQILSTDSHSKNSLFKSGLIGNYFVNLMMVKNGYIKKMKSPKDKNPANSKLSITTIDRFLKQQELLKSLLIRAKQADLSKKKQQFR